MSKRSEGRRGGSSLRQPACSLISLGCPKNLVDSEAMLARIKAAGVAFIPDGSNADCILLNTCAFLEDARKEACDCIQELVRLKKNGELRFIVVAGCLVRHGGESLRSRFPEVDLWFSPFDEQDIGNQIRSLFDRSEGVNDGSGFFDSASQKLCMAETAREQLTAPHVAYLKIADGCNRFCSYCLIPSLRGRFVSKDRQVILDEARRLSRSGVRELVLIAQETTFWGSDLEGQPALASLLADLRKQGGFDWIRVLYSYPMYFTDDLIAQFGMRPAGETSVLPYIDLPLQHCNDSILRQMNRRVNRQETEELLAHLRESIPDVVLRTSIITGFPGETDDIFQELLEFMDKWKFDRAGVFRFSAEKGTPASLLPNQVPERVKEARYRKLYARQERITHVRAHHQIGKILDVMIDSPGKDEQGHILSDLFFGRTAADSPDIDPIVCVTGEGLVPGTLVPCEIVEANGLDLVAVPAEQEDKKKPFRKGR